MKNILSLLLSLLVLSNIGFAQDLIKFKGDNGKYGYKDIPDNVIIEAKYDQTDGFNEGFATVFIGELDLNGYPQKGKFGFIDKTGKEVIPIIYDFAMPFFDGLAGVKKDGKVFYIDKQGKYVKDLR